MLKKTLFGVLITLSTCVNAQDFNPDGSLIIKEKSKSKEYGYTGHWKHSINVGSEQNVNAYFKSLRGPKGQPIQYNKVEECCKFATPNGFIGVGYLDKMEINYEGLSNPIYLYINAYDYDNPKIPVGFQVVK